ncbi:uncharacterized protein LOC112567653 isoform X1 [Pomacea canaliculata]|uniref:uncharacterized protein LOC112567653 isoform X1 n=2 Tax=Pomacea canaliculata TaxID=400727 RepID=UPI000D7291CF|nr:uncharacterized protein LOC112567653 isoform X1 [Pomacea canaliculata]XP_025100149.1 uncharacterized protein LOC112567653 isoform X1 [Pomacea canaliculata]XP_025100150.1 uncharacterized protein LOC112567653 isoform X1 [Pomacea canaliculata]
MPVTGKKNVSAIIISTVMLNIFTVFYYTATTGERGKIFQEDFSDSKLAGLRVTMETASTSGVKIYRTDNYSCSHLLPFRLSDGTLAKICTYDPNVDYIAIRIKESQAFEDNLVTDIMLALRSAEKKLLSTAQPSSKDDQQNVTLVDLGSNIGVFTLTEAMAGYEVLAVDAMRETLQLMVTSLHLAGVTSRVTVLHNAVSDVRGVIHMKVNRQNMGASMVNQEKNTGQNDRGDDNVTAVFLSDLIPYVRSRHVVVKMDIEGFEERALWSAGEFFEKIDVYSVLMEWSFHRGDSGPPIIRFMSLRGMLPYSDANKSQALDPNFYSTWPGNVVFIR